MKNKNVLIISFYEPQYLYFYKKYIEGKKLNVDYYFYTPKKKLENNIYFQNIKLAIKYKKIFSLFLYYFLKIIFLNLFSSKYRKLKKNIFTKFYSKKIEDFSNCKRFSNINEINVSNKDTLIVFGFKYIDKLFFERFKYRYNVHLGELPNYAGLKSFERSIIDNKNPCITINEITSRIDMGKILFKKKVNYQYHMNPFEIYIKMFHESFEIVCQIIDKELKFIYKSYSIHNDSKNNYSFFGFEFNELKVIKFLKKFN